MCVCCAVALSLHNTLPCPYSSLAPQSSFAHSNKKLTDKSRWKKDEIRNDVVILPAVNGRSHWFCYFSMIEFCLHEIAFDTRRWQTYWQSIAKLYSWGVKMLRKWRFRSFCFTRNLNCKHQTSWIYIICLINMVKYAACKYHYWHICMNWHSHPFFYGHAIISIFVLLLVLLMLLLWLLSATAMPIPYPILFYLFFSWDAAYKFRVVVATDRLVFFVRFFQGALHCHVSEY